MDREAVAFLLEPFTSDIRLAVVEAVHSMPGEGVSSVFWFGAAWGELLGLLSALGIRTLEDLQASATDGRIRSLPGMGARKEALILKALEERRQHAGRRLLRDAQEAAHRLVSFLAHRTPGAEMEAVGSLAGGLCAIVVSFFLGKPIEYPALAIVLLMSMVWTHRGNIERMMKGTENKV